MTFSDIMKESWLSISGNKIRSFLTILGIIIGVAAVVVMVTVGETVQRQIDEQFSALGTNTIIIRAGAAQIGGVRTAGGGMRLTIQDAEAIATLPGVDMVGPMRSAQAQVIAGSRNWSTQLMGVWPQHQQIQNIEMSHGVFFDRAALRNASTHAVIGTRVARELDLLPNPVGQVIRIGQVPLVVVGMTREMGDGMQSTDDAIFVPLSTMQQRIQSWRFHNAVPTIMLRLHDTADNNFMTEQITALLRDRHRLRDTDRDTFQITDMRQVMETMNTVAGIMNMLLISIAAVSLLVGSIGIMNMMLVSVSERTREIGIRKAIGAKESNIIVQFMSESVVISFIGSMIGLLIGIGGAMFVVPALLESSAQISYWAVIISFVVAIVVGLASGVFPAIKAAKLNPIDSLRHE
ncbi:MAG: ABC transporter permease [Alphaproteobacteria bacterium]|nr:ABC transporter permease [Alphaproteobacteria bacterium]